MSVARWLLRVAFVALAALWVVQLVQLVSALLFVAGADAFAVSPMLVAALAFKGLLLLLNLVLLLLVRRSLRRRRDAAGTRPIPPPAPEITS